MVGLVRIVVFFAVALTILMGSHWLVYATTVRFLGLESQRVVLLCVLLALGMSFVVTALISRVLANPVTDLLQWASSLWLGLVIYLIMALPIVWLVYGVSRAAGLSPDMRIVTGVLYGMAAALTLYGAVNALSPRVRKVDVRIEGLPDAWKGKTVVHLSDLHLGAIRGKGYLATVVRKVNALEPEIILITGDLFDGMGGRLDSYAGLLDSLEANRGVYFATGNHEGYLGLAGPLAALARTRIRVLDDEVVDLDGLQIVGIGFPEHDRPKDLHVKGDIDPDRPSILLFHTPTDVQESSKDRADQQKRTYIAPETTFTFARRHGIDLQLSGHTHQGQFWPFTAIARAIFNGYDYGLHTDGGFSIYVTSGAGTWGPPLRVGSSSEIAAIRLD